MKVGQTLSGAMPGKGGARLPGLPGVANRTARLTAHSSNAGGRRYTSPITRCIPAGPDHDGGDKSAKTGRME